MIYAAGFYKADGSNLLYGPENVYGPTFTLIREQHSTYTYPVDGWYWFDTPEQAIAALNLPVQGVQSDGSISPLDFMERFTETEQLAITTAALASPKLLLWYQRLLAAPSVHLGDGRLIAGVQELVSAGLITGARAAEVLKA